MADNPAGPKALDLRRTAELCRRVASIPTTGGRHADRILLALAAKLDHGAADAERHASGPSQNEDQLFDFGRRASDN